MEIIVNVVICGDIGSCKSLDEVIEKLGQYEFVCPEKG